MALLVTHPLLLTNLCKFKFLSPSLLHLNLRHLFGFSVPRDRLFFLCLSIALVQSDFILLLAQEERLVNKEIKHKLLFVFLRANHVLMALHSLSCAPYCGVSFLLLELFTIFWSSAEKPFLSSACAQNYPLPYFPLCPNQTVLKNWPLGLFGALVCVCVCVSWVGGRNLFPICPLPWQPSWHLVPVFLSFCYFFSLPHLLISYSEPQSE